MVAEEIEIIVTARVEEALREFKKMLPEIKKQIGQIQSEVGKVDFKNIAKNINFDKVTKEVEKAKKNIEKEFNKTSFTINGKVANLPVNNKLPKEQQEMKAKIQELSNELEKTPRNTTAYDIILSKIHTLNRELQGLPPQIKKVNTELNSTNMPQQLTNNSNSTNINVAPSGNSMSMWDILRAKIEQAKPAIERFKMALESANSNKQLELVKYKISEIEEKLQGGVNGEIHLSTKEVVEAEAELEKLNNKKAQLEKSGGGSNVFAGMSSAIQKIIPQMNGMSEITIKIKNQIKQMSTNMKQGLGHILKYAGALVSLRGIYSTLRATASAWLSSQNAGAKQLATNIDYMKNAMRKCFSSSNSICYQFNVQFVKSCSKCSLCVI